MTSPRDIVVHRPGALLGVLNVALGLVLMLGGPDRTISPSFATARQIMPIRWWGLAFLLVGVLCLLAINLGRWRAGPVVLGAAAHTFWAVAFLMAAWNDSRAALTGIVVYGWLAGLHLLTGARLSRAA